MQPFAVLFAALWLAGLASGDALDDKATLQELIPNVRIEKRKHRFRSFRMLVLYSHASGPTGSAMHAAGPICCVCRVRLVGLELVLRSLRFGSPESLAECSCKGILRQMPATSDCGTFFN